MKKILYTTDFSETAMKAYIYALELAKIIDAEIVTLHAYTRPVLPASGYFPKTYTDIFEQLRNNEFQAYKDVAKVMHEIAEKYNLEDVKNTFLMIEDDTKDAIMQTIEKENIELVVMGTKGATGLKEVFLGSVTSYIMEHSSVPVMAIPENAKLSDGIERILFTSDFYDFEIGMLKYALDLADTFNASINCVNTAVEFEEYKQQCITQWNEKLKLSKYNKVTFGSEIFDNLDDINEYIEKQDFDLVIMPMYKSNFFEELFNLNLTKKMSHHSTIPLLVIPEDFA